VTVRGERVARASRAETRSPPKAERGEAQAKGAGGATRFLWRHHLVMAASNARMAVRPPPSASANLPPTPQTPRPNPRACASHISRCAGVLLFTGPKSDTATGFTPLNPRIVCFICLCPGIPETQR